MVSRLGFAIATCVSADVVIADEVLSVGDARFRMKCEQRIDKLLSGGTTFLLVSHSTPSVKKLCRKVTCNGRISLFSDNNCTNITI